MKSARQTEVVAVSAMLLAAAIWGSTFVVQIMAAHEGLSAMQFIAYRFLVGAIAILACCPFAKISIARMLKPTSAGLTLGAFIWAAAWLQQVGMETTTSAKGGFITGLSVVGVPLIVRFLYGRAISKVVWISAVTSALGLWLLCGIFGEHFIQGDLWVFACMIVFSFQTALTGEVVQRFEPLILAFQQSAVAGILGTASVLISGQPIIISLTHTSIFSILYAGVLSSGLAYTIQVFAQKRVAAPVAILVFGLESVFAALGGWIILHEHLTALQILGACLMLGGAVCAVRGQPLAHEHAK